MLTWTFIQVFFCGTTSLKKGEDRRTKKIGGLAICSSVRI
jgi:hypothetical protein